MESYYAPAERTACDTLKKQEIEVHKSSVITALMKMLGGVVAILNDKREIISVNEEYLKLANLTEISEAIGLRLGETLSCIHSNEMPGGCGTSKSCSTCGAAISIVSCLATNKPQTRFCSINVSNNNKNNDIYLKVSGVPIEVDGHKMILLFLEDNTSLQKWNSYERIFYHDLQNMIGGVVGIAEILMTPDPSSSSLKSEMTKELFSLSNKMRSELNFQKILLEGSLENIQPLRELIDAAELMQSLTTIYHNHPVSLKKGVAFVLNSENFKFKSDCVMIMRILTNMITNALESSRDGEVVTVSIENNQISTPPKVEFSIHNKGVISTEIQERIFTKNFSTKEGGGRGLGTWSMKLLGEEFLGGEVSFSSDQNNGTIFKFVLNQI